MKRLMELSLEIPEPLHREIALIAAARGLTLEQAFVELVASGVKHHGPPNPGGANAHPASLSPVLNTSEAIQIVGDMLR